MMDHLAPRSGRDLGSRQRVEGVLVDVATAWCVVEGERMGRFERVEDVAEVRAFEDAVDLGHVHNGNTGNRRGVRGQRTFITSVRAIMSWSPCCFSVKAAMMKPIQRIRNETILLAIRPRARPKEIRRPYRSVTLTPSAIFPRVACDAELSITT